MNGRYGFQSPGTLPRKAVLISLLTGLGIFLAVSLHAQEDNEPFDLENLRTLLLLIFQQEQLMQIELEDLSKEAPTPRINLRRNELSAQLDLLYANFEGIATQHSTEELLDENEGKTDWIKEVEALTLPLLHAISDLTKKPRRIDKLNKKIEALGGKLRKLEDASRNITALMEMGAPDLPPDDPLAQSYFSRLKTLKNKYTPQLTRFKLREARHNLVMELEDKRPLLEIFTGGMKDFFKHRGRNLLITVATFAGLWWFLMKLRGLMVGKRGLLNLSTRIKKVLRAAYNTLVMLVCVAASLVSLYLLNDWLLLSVIIIILIGVTWTSRQLIPIFFKEVQLALNLGTVRENERLLWNGIPWLVKSIGISAKLVNEQLEDGNIILPLRVLIGKYTRPLVKDEPWFPTSTEDWVLLSDGTYGKVERQTQEQVVLRLKGGTLKYYPTMSFLEMIPMNISHGFRYDIDFGLDYKVQSKICDEIPKIFEDGLKTNLKNRFEGKPPDFSNLEVRFDHAGSSSLNLKILVHVDGRCADRYEEHQREIQKTLVQLCNKNGLTIPFNQLTISLPQNTQNPLDTSQNVQP